MQSSCFFMFLLFIIGVSAYRYESEEHIDHFVETHYNVDHAHSYASFKETGIMSGSHSTRRNSKISDFGDEETKKTESRGPQNTDDFWRDFQISLVYDLYSLFCYL